MKIINDKHIVYISKGIDKTGTKIIDEPVETSYFKMIEECCNRPGSPQSGFTYDEMKSIDRVKTSINNAEKGVANFEDSDFSFIKSRVETNTWRVASIEFINFVDYIKEIK
jgi:hypothetical protein